MKLGILGGTFDPIHNGHLAIAKRTYEELNLDKILFTPSCAPPHKVDKNIVDYPYRMAMIEIALKDYPHFQPSDFDFTPGATSYTKHLIESCQLVYPRAEIYFIIGGDQLTKLHTWYEIEWLFKQLRFAAFYRPGTEIDLSNLTPYLDRIVQIEMEPIAVSSEQIRDRLRGGLSVERMLPANVLDFIQKQGLYRKI
ncbi:MAG: nicotinate-nucleotide adenylyltransferase [Candidatus Cloacimonas sp.]|nr:nicotinate-nucleotide adenylyltransferase [Candidatus Cloacimonadota bacterium]